MPVILDNGSDELRTWLDPKRNEWTKELQSLLKPFEGDLECYPVSKDVGKVGNNSPDFIVPVTSTQNKQNIANFFGNAKKSSQEQKPVIDAKERSSEETLKRKNDQESEAPSPRKAAKIEGGDTASLTKSSDTPSKSFVMQSSPEKIDTQKKLRSAITNSSAPSKSPVKSHSKGAGSQKITSFFGK